jgi:putative Ca2+/H+ antiporter (TMEM165/GDT1 family)
MDALLISFIAVLLAEVGARTQNVSFMLGQQSGDKTGVAVALTGIVAVSLIASAIGGIWVTHIMNPRAALLMMGLALSFAGLGQFRRLKPILAQHQGVGTRNALVRLGLAHVQDGTPFLVFAVAARAGDAVLAAFGGTAAVLLLCLPSILIADDWHQPALLLRLRRIGGAILSVAGIWAILAALQVI